MILSQQLLQIWAYLHKEDTEAVLGCILKRKYTFKKDNKSMRGIDCRNETWLLGWGDAPAYKPAWGNPKKSIREVKCKYKQCIEKNLDNCGQQPQYVEENQHAERL